MKTTLEIDRNLLRRVMELAGVSTISGAIEFAFRSTEQMLLRRRLLEERLTREDLGGCADPHQATAE